LREAIWLNLAHAEGELRAGERLTAETLDFDGDGSDEVWVHSSRFSAVVSPSRGGAVVEYTIFEDGINYADVLTRRWEAYHDAALAEAARAAKEASHAAATPHADPGGVASIHDLERAMTLVERPPVDLDDRALLVDRMLGAEVTAERHALAAYKPVKSWGRAAMSFEAIQEEDAVEIVCTGDALVKRIRFSEDGSITVTWNWDGSAFDPGTRFTSECSLFRPLELEATPAATRWVAPVETVAKSERGLDRTIQGESVTLLWSATVGNAKLVVRGIR
jgi:hypothetical protein